jgi:hypothetical protein
MEVSVRSVVVRQAACRQVVPRRVPPPLDAVQSAGPGVREPPVAPAELQAVRRQVSEPPPASQRQELPALCPELSVLRLRA